MRLARRSGFVRALMGFVAGLSFSAAGTPPASADCALIPTALQILPSTLGGVDRPFASPGDSLRVVSKGACDPTADQFDLDPANHEIRISFPGAPAVADFVLDPGLIKAVADCGDDRCFALEFEMPDTTDHSVMAGTGQPLAGPITIHVKNNNPLVDAEVATIGELFEPTRACNPQNRYRNLFGNFTLLPPRNSFANGVNAMRGTLDGTGSLLIPLAYGEVLTNALGGTANLRLLSVKANVANGLASPLPQVPVGDQGLIRIPRDGNFVRSFSFEGRPIPPLLEVTSSTMELEVTSYGDKILGSVDFIDSVIRIAKTGPDPDGPGDVTIFELAAGGLDPLDGSVPDSDAGPIPLNGLTLGIGPVAPLNSLKIGGKAAAVARDESLEGGSVNSDGDQDDLVVGIINLDTGEDFSTGFSVLEVAQSPRKAAIVTRGSRVAFLQSEANDDADVNGDGDKLDGAPRYFDVDGSQFSLGLLSAADPSAKFNGSAPLALGDEWLFFLESEKDGTVVGTERESVRFDEGEPVVASFDPAISGDGRQVAFATTDPRIVVSAPVVWETTGGPSYIDQSLPPAVGSFAFFDGDAGVPGVDYGASTIGFGETQAFTCAAAPTGLTGLFWFNVGYSTLTSEIPFFTMWVPAPSDPFGCASTTSTGAFVVDTGPSGVFDDQSTVTLTGPLAPGPQALGGPGLPGDGPYVFPGFTQLPGDLSNHRVHIDLDVTDGTFVDLSGVGDGPNQFSYTTEQYYVADTTSISGQQVYLTKTDVEGTVNELISKGFKFGEPGNDVSSEPSLDFDGSLVAFLSRATNLVDDGGSGASEQVFLRDRVAGSTVRVSKAAAGGPSDGLARSPVISSDGSTVAYISTASDITPSIPVQPGSLYEVYAYDVAGGTSEFVSLDLLGGRSGSGFYPNLGLSSDGDEIVFASIANDLVANDTNGLVDIFLRDRSAGTTERVSVGLLGAESNGASTDPDVSGDGNRVVFASEATNLVANPGTSTQCYVYDRGRKTTQLVSRTLSGEASNGTCSLPKISRDGRYVAFLSTAGDLGPGTSIRRVYRADLLTGVVAEVSLAGNGDPADLASPQFEPPSINADGSFVTFASPATNLGGGPDTNAVADIYTHGLLDLRDDAGLDLNADGDSNDSVLKAMDDFETEEPQIRSSGKEAVQVETASGVPDGVGDMALFLDAQGQVWAFVPGANQVVFAGSGVAKISLSRDAACSIDQFDRLTTGSPDATLDLTPAPTGLPIEGVTEVRAVDGTPGSPGGKCVFTTNAGDLYYAPLQTTAVVLVGQAKDFQVDPAGIAYRVCEDQAEADLNGDLDTDAGDCEMRFYDFASQSVVRTYRTAVPCTLPGCDPFFEPYRIRGNVLSFVSREQLEVNAFGTGQRGDSCLPTSPAGLCDVTGDNDGDDLAVQIVNVRSSGLKAQVFPISEKNPPQASPFPEVTQNDQGVIFIELPAAIVPGFETLPPEQLVSVLAVDTDGDGSFDNDGLTNPRATVTDNCRELGNELQIDADRDGLGKGCDLKIDTTLENDDPGAPAPGAAAEVPGDDLCDLNRDQLISQNEVDQVWADRGVPISAPKIFGVEASDNRDPDADGEITAVDHSICLGMCQGQAGGCQIQQVVAPATSGSCGLLGAELLPLLWFMRRRRCARHEQEETEERVSRCAK